MKIYLKLLKNYQKIYQILSSLRDKNLVKEEEQEEMNAFWVLNYINYHYEQTINM